MPKAPPKTDAQRESHTRHQDRYRKQWVQWIKPIFKKGGYCLAKYAYTKDHNAKWAEMLGIEFDSSDIPNLRSDSVPLDGALSAWVSTFLAQRGLSAADLTRRNVQTEMIRLVWSSERRLLVFNDGAISHLPQLWLSAANVEDLKAPKPKVVNETHAPRCLLYEKLNRDTSHPVFSELLQQNPAAQQPAPVLASALQMGPLPRHGVGPDDLTNAALRPKGLDQGHGFSAVPLVHHQHPGVLPMTFWAQSPLGNGQAQPIDPLSRLPSPPPRMSQPGRERRAFRRSPPPPVDVPPLDFSSGLPTPELSSPGSEQSGVLHQAQDPLWSTPRENGALDVPLSGMSQPGPTISAFEQPAVPYQANACPETPALTQQNSFPAVGIWPPQDLALSAGCYDLGSLGPSGSFPGMWNGAQEPHEGAYDIPAVASTALTDEEYGDFVFC